MAENDTLNPDPGWYGAAVSDPAVENDVFVDLFEVEIVLDAPDNGAETGGDGLMQGEHSAFLIDDIDLGDVIADVDAPHETDLTALLDQPVDDFTPGLMASEQSREEGFSLTLVGVDAGEGSPPADPAVLQDSASDPPAGGFVSVPVAIIIDDGSDGFGTPV